MRHNLRLFFFLFLINPLCEVKSQDFIPDFTVEASFSYKGLTPSQYFKHYIDSLYLQHLPDTCFIAGTQISFKIDSYGNIIDINFPLETTPESFKTILTETIMSSKGMWKPKEINNILVDSDDFLLTVVFASGECEIKGPSWEIINVYDGTRIYQHLEGIIIEKSL